MLNKPTIILLQDVLKHLKTAAPEDATDLHNSLARLQEKIECRVAEPALPAHPAVKFKSKDLELEVRKLQLATVPTRTRARMPGRHPRPKFDLGAITHSVKRLNYYLALPGQDEPDVP
jgi:hypothetical protein